MATSLEFAVVNDGMSSGPGMKLRVAGSPTRTSGWGEAGTAVHEGITAPQTWLDDTIYPGGTTQVYVSDARTAGEILKEWKLD